CFWAQAEIIFNDTLSVHAERMTITTWDANTIVFVSTPLCVTYVYTISRATERISGQRSPNESADDGCKIVEQRVFNLTLRDGFQVSRQLEQEVSSKTSPFMWAAIGVWWAFVVFKAFRRRRIMPSHVAP